MITTQTHFGHSIVTICLVIGLIFLFGCESQDMGDIIQYARDDQVDLLKQTIKPLPWTYLELNNDPKNFQFVIVTDRRGGTRPGVFEQGIEKINLLALGG
jgi:hypothetical protein